MSNQSQQPVSLPTQAFTVEPKQVKQSKDKAQYVRQQQGHSLIKHLLFGWIVLWIPAIYFSVSPNHYWHA